MVQELFFQRTSYYAARVHEMPKYVDHHARRLLVTEVAAEIVAARGVEALTVRAVAAATGFSTAVVSHYFLDKRDLLRSTFRAAANRSTSRFESAATADRRSVVSCLEALLPLDDDSRRDWRVFVAFWGTAASDNELADRAARPCAQCPRPDRARGGRADECRVWRSGAPPGRPVASHPGSGHRHPGRLRPR